jgi:hypothetical protein
MTNTNCPEGIRCPECGYEDGFYVEAIVTLLVSDDGTEDRGGDHFWDEESHPFTSHHSRPAELFGVNQ